MKEMWKKYKLEICVIIVSFILTLLADGSMIIGGYGVDTRIAFMGGMGFLLGLWWATKE